MTDLSAAAFVVVEPRYNTYGDVKGIRLDRVTQGRPQNLQGGEVAFRLEVTLPAQVFRPIGDVIVAVPESEIIVPVVEVGN